MTRTFTHARSTLIAFIVIAALSLCGFASQAYAESSATQDAATTQTRAAAAKPMNKPTKAGWMKDADGTWYYFTSVKAAPKTGWLKLGGKWYYLNPEANGALVTGYFATKDGAKYIADGSGALYTNRWVHYKGDALGSTLDDWFYATSSGALKTGWFKSSGKWYYLEPKYGLMATDVPVGDYQLTASGEMATGWLKRFDNWYLYNSAGKKTTGWQKRGGKWYYLNPDKDGALKTGMFSVGTAYYITDSNGAMYANRWILEDNEWYYATSSGALKVGWLKSGGKWYWMQPNSGPMAKGDWINDGKYDYYITESGVMATGWVKYKDSWFYLTKSGTKFYGWLKSGGKWYYLDKAKNGAMLASTTKNLDGKWYSFNADGSMK